MENPLEHAQELMLWGNYEEAQAIFLELLAENPESDHIYYHLGLCNLSFEHFDQAVDYLTHCLSINAKHIDAMVDLGDACLSLERDEEAGYWFRKAYAQEPKNPRVVVSLAHFHDYREEYERAVELYEKAMVLSDPSEAPRYDLALVYGKVGRYLEADLMIDGIITESLRRGTQSFIGDWNAGSRQDLASSIREMREERENLAQAYLRERGQDILYGRAMYFAIQQVKLLQPDTAATLYREIRTLSLVGFDRIGTRNHYRLNSLDGSFAGLFLSCLQYATAKELKLDEAGDPLLVKAWEEAHALFPW